MTIYEAFWKSNWKQLTPLIEDFLRNPEEGHTSNIISQADKYIINQYKRPQQPTFDSQVQNQPHSLRDPEPNNSTPEQSKDTARLLNKIDDIEESKETMKKQHNIIRLTESQLRQVIKESVSSILLEYEREWTEDGDPLYWEFCEQYSEDYIFQQFRANPKQNNMWLPLINPSEYHQALKDFMTFGKFTRFPANRVYQWLGLCLKNIALLRATTSIYGHSQWVDTDAFVDNFFEGDWESFEEWCQEHDEDADWGGESKWLEENGFYQWSDSGTQTPPYSDYGLAPLEKLASQFHENMSPEQALVLLNKILDVTHQRGDLCKLFIKGGTRALYNISNH